jgi:hypothetical protein
MSCWDYNKTVLCKSIKGLPLPEESVAYVFEQGSVVIAL